MSNKRDKKVLPFFQRPSKHVFKTQEEIKKENQKKRESILNRTKRPKS